MRATRNALLAAASAFLLTTAPAAQAAEWRDGGAITDPRKRAQPVEALTTAWGPTLLAWSGYLDEGSRPHIRTRFPQGRLSSPRRLSGQTEYVNAFGNDQGDVLLASHVPGGSGRLLVRSGVNGDVSAPEPIFEPGPAERICGHTAAVGMGGRAVVLYSVGPPSSDLPSEADLERCELRMRVRAGRAAGFGPPTVLQGPTGLILRDVQFDASGRAIGMWDAGGSVHTVRVDPSTGATEQQSVGVAGEAVIRGVGPFLRVADGGRALIAFGTKRPDSDLVRVAAATGGTSAGFGTPRVLSGRAHLPGLDAAIGADGTAAVVWRGGSSRSHRVHAVLAKPNQELTRRRARTLSGRGARLPRVGVSAGRATVAWIARVPRIGRAVQATTGRPGARFPRARRLSRSVVATGAPKVTVARNDARWVTWGERLTGSTKAQFSALKSRRVGARARRFSRVLEVLRTDRTNGELIGDYELHPLKRGAMLATVERYREQQREPRSFWQLRLYGE